MERIPQEIIEEMRESLVGSRVSVNYTDSRGKRQNVKGVCQYFGYNEFFPSWDIQVTIGRMPIPHLQLSDIELI